MLVALKAAFKISYIHTITVAAKGFQMAFANIFICILHEKMLAINI